MSDNDFRMSRKRWAEQWEKWKAEQQTEREAVVLFQPSRTSHLKVRFTYDGTQDDYGDMHTPTLTR